MVGLCLKNNPLNTFKSTEFGNGPKIPGSVAFINFVAETILHL